MSKSMCGGCGESYDRCPCPDNPLGKLETPRLRSEIDRLKERLHWVTVDLSLSMGYEGDWTLQESMKAAAALSSRAEKAEAELVAMKEECEVVAGAAMARFLELESERDKLKALLAPYQYAAEHGVVRCTKCGVSRDVGCRDDCKLAEALK